MNEEKPKNLTATSLSEVLTEYGKVEEGDPEPIIAISPTDGVILAVRSVSVIQTPAGEPNVIVLNRWDLTEKVLKHMKTDGKVH